MRKTFVIILNFVVALSLVILPSLTSAVYDGGDGAEVAVKLDVSKDDVNWYNFSADTNPGGQTLVASPGDTLIFRAKTWDPGTAGINNLVFSASVTNSQYLDITSGFYDDDLDGNSNPYTGVGIGGFIGLDTINFGTIEDGTGASSPEIGTFRVRIKENTPDQTLIEGTFELVSAGNVITPDSISFAPVAYAQGLTDTKVKILISNPQATLLPRTGASK